MQTLVGLPSSQDFETRLIENYLGRQVFLKRVVHGSVGGLWLQWLHPGDVGRKGAPKCGMPIARGVSLESALQQVHQAIEASVELEQMSDSEQPCVAA